MASLIVEQGDDDSHIIEVAADDLNKVPGTSSVNAAFGNIEDLVVEEGQEGSGDQNGDRKPLKDLLKPVPVQEFFSGGNLHIHEKVPDIADETGKDQVRQVVDILNPDRKHKAFAGIDDPETLGDHLDDRDDSQTPEHNDFCRGSNIGIHFYRHHNDERNAHENDTHVENDIICTMHGADFPLIIFSIG